MTLKTQVTHGMKWKVLAVVGRQLISLVVFTAIARALQPSSFGLVGLVSVYLAFVALFADQGISAALVQRKELLQEHLDTAFWFNVGCATLLCLITVAGAPWIARFYGEPHLVPLLRCASLSLIINAFGTVHGTVFTRAMDFKRPAVRLVLANLLGGLVGLAMALTGFEVWALIGQQLTFALTGSAFLWIVSPYRPTFRFSLTRLRELLNVSSSVLTAAVLWFFSTRLDQIVIGRFAGASALGFYLIGGKVPDLAKTVAHDAIADVSLPALAKLQDDHVRMNRAIYRGMEMNAYMSFAIFGGIAAVAPDLVPVLFGSKWQEAAGICALLAVYALVNALQVFFHPALLASGGTGNYVLLNLWHTIGVAVACVAGIQFGINYLVLGLILNGIIVAIPALLYLRKRTGLSPMEYCRSCLVPASGALVMAAAVWLTRAVFPATLPIALRLAVGVLAGGLAYLGVTYLLKRALWEEALVAVRQVLGRKAKARS